MANQTLEQRIKELGNEYAYWQVSNATFSERPYDSKLRKGISKKVHPEIQNAENQFNGMQPDLIDNYIQLGINHSTSEVINYAKPNIQEILNESSPQVLYQGARGMKPYEISDETHDSIVKKHKEFLEAQQCASSPEAMRNYIEKSKAIEKYFIPAFIEASLADEIYLKRVFTSTLGTKESRFLKEFIKDDENISKEKLIGYINSNLAKSNDNEKDNFYLASGLNFYSRLTH